MENLIIAAIVLVIVGLAARYVYKAKKSGRACIGCPDGGCSCQEKKEDAAPCNCGCCGSIKE